MSKDTQTLKENIAKIDRRVGALKARINGSDKAERFGTLRKAYLQSAETIVLNKIPTEAQRLYLVKLGVWNNTSITLDE